MVETIPIPGRADIDLEHWIVALRSLPTGSVAEGDVLAWVEGPLRGFFPFDRFLGCYGRLSGGRIQMRSLVSSGYSSEFLCRIENKFDASSRSCFAWWVSNRRPFILDEAGAFDQTGAAIHPSEQELEEITRFSLGAVAAHGVIDPFVPAGTYISFAGVPRKHPARTLAWLEIIAPVLHTLYLRTVQAAKSAVDLSTLTDRQRELVDLVLEGLPDKVIASRLAISDNTVGNHFRSIYARLGVRSRSQLIALLK